MEFLNISEIKGIKNENLLSFVDKNPKIKVIHTSFPSFFPEFDDEKVSIDKNNLISFHCNEVVLLKANTHIPPSLESFYFEIKIVSQGENKRIGIGLATQEHPQNKMPGWFGSSYGYHGDDGVKKQKEIS